MSNERPSALARVPAMVWIVALQAVLFLPYLHMPITDGDGTLNSLRAQNILRTGDWVTMVPFMNKPPAGIWPHAISYALFGVSDASARLWQLVVAAGVLGLTYATAHLFLSHWVSLRAALLLLATPLFAYLCAVPQQDLLTLLAYGLALYGYLRLVRDGRWWGVYLFAVGVALGTLTRALAGIALPVGTVLLFELWQWRADPEGPRLLRSLRGPVDLVAHLVLGLALYCVLVAPWYLAAGQAQGWDYVNLLLGTGNRRFLGQGEGVGARRLLYVALLFAGYLPFSVLLPGVVATAWRGCRAALPDGSDRRWLLRFLTTWLVVALGLCFSIRWLNIRFVLPSLPPLVIVTALYLEQTAHDERSRAARRWVVVSAVLGLTVAVPLFLGVGAYYARRFPGDINAYWPIFAPALFALITGCVCYAGLALYRRFTQAVAVLAVLAAVGTLAGFREINSRWDTVWPWRQLGEESRAAARVADAVLWYRDSDPRSGARFGHYARRQPISVGSLPALRPWLRSRRVVVPARQEELPALRELEPDVRVLSQHLGWVVVANFPAGAGGTQSR